MKTPIGTEVDIGAGHIVLDGFLALRERGTAPPPSFRPMSIVATVAHLSYCWALVKFCRMPLCSSSCGVAGFVSNSWYCNFWNGNVARESPKYATENLKMFVIPLSVESMMHNGVVSLIANSHTHTHTQVQTTSCYLRRRKYRAFRLTGLAGKPSQRMKHNQFVFVPFSALTLLVTG